jgi:peptidoglycan/xylan/chitin deacetylase (PgdA/CDA1 family)
VKPKEFWAPYRGAVSLVFDDGLPSQLDKGIPMLDEFGLKASFYLVPNGDDWRERLDPWMAVGQAGHEIANHTCSHYISRNHFASERGFEDLALDEIEADILLAQERLQQIAPHQQDWTFAYPASQTDVGTGANRRSYVPVVAKHFLAGRIRAEYGFGNYPHLIDLAAVWTQATVRMGGFEMIGLVEALTAQGQWVILGFHEIDGSRLTIGTYDFRMLLDYLNRKSDEIWTAPLVEVARKIADARGTR